MDPRELKFANAFNSIPGVGAGSLRALKNFFGNLEGAWQAGEAALQEARIDSSALHGILWKRASVNPERELEKLIRANLWLISEEDSNFPKTLREIAQPPLLLYGQGDIKLLTAINEEKLVAIAVVGTRKPTSYGLEATEVIVRQLVKAGLVVISGLASGIDGKAHAETLANQGKTIAVLGSGIDQPSIFPPENQGLAKRIADSGGIVLSEYTHGTPAVKEHFPQRNRIVSGMSRGVLVVEAREKSGALITARLALDQNREVFAVPGSIFARPSVSPNRLIQQGAKLVTSAEDILEELGLDYAKEKDKNKNQLLSEKEKFILNILEENLTVDQLKERTGFDTATLISNLSLLELKELVRNLGNDTYQKC